jgi:hypothetical protein
VVVARDNLEGLVATIDRLKVCMRLHAYSMSVCTRSVLRDPVRRGKSRDRGSRCMSAGGENKTRKLKIQTVVSRLPVPPGSVPQVHPPFKVPSPDLVRSESCVWPLLSLVISVCKLSVCIIQSHGIGSYVCVHNASGGACVAQCKR